MKWVLACLLVAAAIVAVLIARFADAAPNPCRATCKAAKGSCIQAFVVCDYQPPGNVEICDSHGMNCVLQKPY